MPSMAILAHMKLAKEVVLRKFLYACLALQFALAASMFSVAGATTGHVVTFNENLSNGTSLNDFEASIGNRSLTLYSQLSPSFLNPGHAFVNWNTSPNGSGTSFVDGSTYNFSTDLTLYAQWKNSFQTVTFNRNRSSADSAADFETRNSPTALTSFSKLAPPFTKSGYSFSSWNTKSNGTGTRYANGATFSFASDLSLYAQWTKTSNLPALQFVGEVSVPQSKPIQPIVDRIQKLGGTRLEIMTIGKSPHLNAISLRIGSLLRSTLVRQGRPVQVHYQQILGPQSSNLIEVFVS